MGKIYQYTVVATQMATDSTLVILLKNRPGRQPMLYEPGQYAAISFIRHNRPTPVRCFSITSSPTEEGYLQFGIRVQGNYTKAAREALAPGAKVIVEGPFGHFTFNPARNRSVLMLAGGIGVTPYISMLRYAERLQLPNDITLLYSCRNQDDVPFLGDLLESKKANPRLQVIFVISSGPTDKLEAAGAKVLTGRIGEELLDQATSRIYAGRTYFICGPPPFMKGMRTILESRGVESVSIITEAFAQGQKGPKAITHNFPLQVYALSGLSILLGSSSVMASDVAAALPQVNNNVGSVTRTITIGVAANNRQNDLSQAISSLQPGSSSSSNSSPSAQNPGADTGNESTAPQAAGTAPSSSSSSKSSSGSSSSSSSGSSGSSGSSSSGGSPSTPPPPPKVAPSLSFAASSTLLGRGKTATLYWSINSDASTPVTCMASGGWSGVQPTSGSHNVIVSATTTYNLTCSNAAGSSAKSITITCKSTKTKPC